MDSDGGRRGLEAGVETVYGTHEDNTIVMSEKVKDSFIQTLFNFVCG